ITTKIKVKDAKYCGTTCQVAPQLSAPKNANYDEAGGTSIAPNIHLIVPLNDKFAWGVNAYSNFGTKTEFSDSYSASEYGGLTDVKSFNLGLAGSYRIDSQWSVGAGLDLIYGKGTMKRTASSDVASLGGKDLVNVDG
ncbi:outer membrane protein transport protein, partial [Vibrio anguillarum]